MKTDNSALAEQVIEGNLSIATFMGGRRLVSGDFWTYFGPDGFEHESGDFLKYHTDWSWLMPVIEHIENIGFQFFIHNEGAYIKKWYYRGNVPDIGNVEETKILAVWKTVIDFIQWHNSQVNKG